MKENILSAIFAVPVIITAAITAAAGPVAEYGRLYADGDKIVGERSGGEAVQLKGPSFYWSHSNWSGRHFYTTDAVDAMIDGWDAQVIRFPLAINENHPERDDGGYDTDPAGNWERLKRVADHAVSRGVYVIIDWHSHTAAKTGEPSYNAAEAALAADFFTNPELAGKYGNDPAVIFELFNEPKDTVAWPKVKAYADTVIGEIRKAGFNNLILVGNPYWTAAPHFAIDDPLTDSLGNFAMVFHFYSNTHFIDQNVWYGIPSNTRYRAMLKSVLAAGIPLFVSEWGTNDASDQGVYNFAEADKWHAFLDSNKISACAWSAAVTGTVLDFWNGWSSPLKLQGGSSVLANWTDPNNMTAHGRYIYRWLTGKDTALTGSGDGWPSFTGLRSPLPLVTARMLESKANAATALNWSVSEDGVLNVKFKLDGTGLSYSPYIGVGLTGDVSRCEWGIGYTYKGSKHTLRPEQSNINDEVGGWDYHYNSKLTGAAADWTNVRVPWAYFQQIGWGGEVEQDVSLVSILNWYVGYLEGSDGTEGEFWIKDVWCLGDPDGEIVSVRPGSRPSFANGMPSYIRIKGRTLFVRMPNSGRIDIFDVKGKRIRAIKLDRGGHSIRLNDLPKGMYAVRASGAAAVRVLVK